MRVTHIRNNTKALTADLADIKRVAGNSPNPCSRKFDHLFGNKLPQLTEYEIDHWKSPINIREIGFLI